MATERRLKRKFPRKAAGRGTLIRSVWSLYLDDIEAIHAVLEDVAKPSVFDEAMRHFDDVIELSHAAGRVHAEEMRQLFEDNREAFEQVGLNPPQKLMEPPPPPPTRPSPQLIEIETDLHEDLTLDDLRNYPQHYARELSINTDNPRIWVWCRPYGYSVRVHDEDKEALEAYDRIVHIIMGRRNRLVGVLRATKEQFIAFSASFAVASLLANVFESIWLFAIIALASLVGIILTFPIDEFVFERRRAVVVLRYERDAPSWWHSAAGEVAKGVLVILIAAFVVWAVGALAGVF